MSFSFFVARRYRLATPNQAKSKTSDIFALMISSSFASLESESLQVSLGMSIGQKWVNTHGFSFELFLGLSRYITDSDNELYVPAGVAIGKRF